MASRLYPWRLPDQASASQILKGGDRSCRAEGEAFAQDGSAQQIFHRWSNPELKAGLRNQQRAHHIQDFWMEGQFLQVQKLVGEGAGHQGSEVPRRDGEAVAQKAEAASE